jgi:signal transduction histidine kinase
LNRITSFVEELLSETRAAAKAGIALQPNDVIRQVLHFLEEHLAKQRVRVDLDLAPGLPEVFADSQQLQQVFLNLLNNAGDAMPGGGIIRMATAVEEAPGGQRFVVVSVSDTGTGIPPEKQAKIFEPFFTTKSLSHGTGLGLGIAARIIHQYGGSIDFKSAPEAGTTFFVRLPAPGTSGGRAEKAERQST